MSAESIAIKAPILDRVAEGVYMLPVPVNGDQLIIQSTDKKRFERTNLMVLTTGHSVLIRRQSFEPFGITTIDDEDPAFPIVTPVLQRPVRRLAMVHTEVPSMWHVRGVESAAVEYPSAFEYFFDIVAGAIRKRTRRAAA